MMRNMSQIVEIDGSVLEGGGQILRMSLVISALSGTPIHVYSIRAGRSKPGLRDQHLKGVQLVNEICNGKLTGACPGSTDITLFPGKVKGGSYNAYVTTAGSISLLMQVAIPCLLFADGPSELRLQGGTNAEMAPQVEYMSEVFRPILRKFGADFDFILTKRGYFPRGGGQVEIRINPVQTLNNVQLIDRGRINALYGWSFVAGSLPINVANDIAEGAIESLKPHYGIRSGNIECYKESREMASDNASGIVIVAESDTGVILGGSSLGKRGENSRKTGARAADEIIKAFTEGACVDEHGQDQVIILMTLAAGISKIRTGEITMHTKTAIYIAEMLTKVKFDISDDGKSSVIACQGIGLRSR